MNWTRQLEWHPTGRLTNGQTWTDWKNSTDSDLTLLEQNFEPMERLTDSKYGQRRTCIHLRHCRLTDDVQTPLALNGSDPDYATITNVANKTQLVQSRPVELVEKLQIRTSYEFQKVENARTDERSMLDQRRRTRNLMCGLMWHLMLDPVDENRTTDQTKPRHMNLMRSVALKWCDIASFNGTEGRTDNMGTTENCREWNQ